MLYTPAALELALLCPFAAPLLSGGEEDRPEMAESILVRGSTVSEDILAGRFAMNTVGSNRVSAKVYGLML